MSVSSKEQKAQKVRILVDKDVVGTSFEKYLGQLQNFKIKHGPIIIYWD